MFWLLLLACSSSTYTKPDPQTSSDTEAVTTDSEDGTDTEGTAADGTGATDTEDMDTEPEDTEPEDIEDTGGDPCAAAVPADAVVYTENATVDIDDHVALVCRNSTVSFAGLRNRVFVLQGGDAVLTGTRGRTWLEKNATARVFAAPNDLYLDDAATVNDDSKDGATVTVCGDLTLDVSAVKDGC